MNFIKTRLGRSLLIIGVSLLVITSSFTIWASSTNPIMPQAEQALLDNDTLTVKTDGFIVFEPKDTPTVGYILYPGGRVKAEAYAPLARAIAEEGYLVAIVYAPLNLAFFDIGAGNAVIEAYPAIEQWAVGGHSLGGVAASLFSESNPKVTGLVFMASYPAGNALANRDDLQVLSIYATNDGLASAEAVLASKADLPENTQFAAIDGGNHAQFGWYGNQDGDNPATISHAEQTEQATTATVGLLELLSAQ